MRPDEYEEFLRVTADVVNGLNSIAVFASKQARLLASLRDSMATSEQALLPFKEGIIYEHDHGSNDGSRREVSSPNT